MLIDVHAHFYPHGSGVPDSDRWNRSRMEACERSGITHQIASVLGTWGARSPIYMSSEQDVTWANDQMLEISVQHENVSAYCLVNPAHGAFALEEIERRAQAGFVGLKLAAARRATDSTVAEVVQAARRFRWPVLQHIWQHRQKDWPGQVASDASELCQLATSFPDVIFILAHIAGGGAWQPSLRSVSDQANVFVDISGSGLDDELLPQTIDAVGASRILFGTDITMGTAMARLHQLERLSIGLDDMNAIRYGNALRIFGLVVDREV